MLESSIRLCMETNCSSSTNSRSGSSRGRRRRRDTEIEQAPETDSAQDLTSSSCFPSLMMTQKSNPVTHKSNFPKAGMAHSFSSPSDLDSAQNSNPSNPKGLHKAFSFRCRKSQQHHHGNNNHTDNPQHNHRHYYASASLFFSGFFKKRQQSQARSSINGDNSSEPVSPKVTCIGQVRAKKSWAASSSSAFKSKNGGGFASANFRIPTSWSRRFHLKKEFLHGLKQFSGLLRSNGFFPSKAFCKHRKFDVTTTPRKQQHQNLRNFSGPVCHIACKDRMPWTRKVATEHQEDDDDDDDDEIPWASDVNENSIHHENDIESMKSEDNSIVPADALVMTRTRSAPVAMQEISLREEKTKKQDYSNVAAAAAESKKAKSKEEEEEKESSDMRGLLIFNGRPGLQMSLDVCKETWLPSTDPSEIPAAAANVKMDVGSRKVNMHKIITPAELVEIATALSNLPEWKHNQIGALILTRSKSEPCKVSAKMVGGWTLRRKSVG